MNQAKLLSKLSGESRLEQAFKLSDFTRELAKQNINADLKLKLSKIQLFEIMKERFHAN